MKVKYVKANGNDCVPRALSQILKVSRKSVAKELPMTKKGVKPQDWMKYAEGKGLKVKKLEKPMLATTGMISEISKGHKGGMVVRAESEAGTHTFFVNKGRIADDVRKVSKNAVMKVHALAYKE